MRPRGAAYAVAVEWINAYICRGWLYHPTAHMATLYGYWTALANSGAWSWRPQWWPFWDLGIPFEFSGEVSPRAPETPRKRLNFE